MNVKKILSLMIGLFLSLIFSSDNTAYSDEYLAPIPAGTFIVTSQYGVFTHSTKSDQYAIDLQMHHDMEKVENYSSARNCMSLGAPILSMKKGRVTKVTNQGEVYGYGTSATVQNDDGTKSLYGHMIYNSLAVEKDEEVEAGQILGLMGDTGFTAGITCPKYNNLDTDPRGFVGLHLHARTLNSSGAAILSEPLIGEESYSDLKRLNTYVSKTTMYDPKGFWAHWRNKVPYQLTYEYNPGYIPYHDFGEGREPKINTIFPLTAKQNKLVNFTIHGEGMSQDVVVDLPECEPNFRRRRHYEQVFSCRIQTESPTPILTGEIWRSEERKQEAEEDSSIEPDLRFSIRLLEENESHGTDSWISETWFGGETWPSYDRTFFVIGKNLPHDLRLDMPGCEEVSYEYRSASRQEIACTLPSYTDQQSKTKLNGYLISDIADIKEPVTLSEDYSTGLFTVSPPNGYYGKRETFVFQGPNLGRTRAAYIHNCGEIEIEPKGSHSVKISCNPQVEAHLFSPRLKKELQSGVHHFLLKAEPGAEITLAEGYLRFDMASQTWIDSVLPQHPILEDKNTFNIQGDNLPDEASAWIENCPDESKNLTQRSDDKSHLIYDCHVGTNGGEAVFDELMNLLPFGEHDDIVWALRDQERPVEIKLSPKYSAGDPAVLFRGTIKPVPPHHATWINDQTRSTLENEALIQEILESDGDYDKDLVESFGWMRAKNKHFRYLAPLGAQASEINQLKTLNNYLLTTCSVQPHIRNRIEKRLAYRLFKEEEEMLPWLPTLGDCAEQIHQELLDEDIFVF